MPDSKKPSNDSASQEGPKIYGLDSTANAEDNTTSEKSAESGNEVGDKKMKNQNKKPKTKMKFKLSKTKKIILGIVIALIILIVVPTAYTGYQVLKLKDMAVITATLGKEAVVAMKSQDLVTAKEKLASAHASAVAMNQQYDKLGYLKATPLRWHYQDGKYALNATVKGIGAAEVVVSSVEPYADVLGLKGEGTFTGGSIEDRIVKILETLKEVAPALDEASVKLKSVSSDIDQIDPSRYPIEIQGQSAEELITQIKEQLNGASTSLDTFIPFLKVLPAMAGLDEEKKYLVMFQNDGEIRPTGGFMTAYSVLNINKGKVTPEKSDDIYELDDKFSENLKPPDPIEKYLPLVKTWKLRDMNLSPDFKESMNTFISYYNELPGEAQVEGVIAIDTKVLENLINVLGPIEVPGYGTYTTEINPRCNCPDVIYQLEDITTKPTPYHRSDRKAILGPMMAAILQKAYDAPQEIWPLLFQTVFKDINEKHILFYFFDEELQQAVETSNFAGRVAQDYPNDYLHINDANFGGAKSNMFISQEVEQDIEIQDGKVKKTVTVVYKNPQKADNCNLEAGQLCLNGVLRDWVRFYVPKGSQLIDSSGFQDGSVEVSEDLGYTVIEGFYTVNPQSQTKLILSFDVPYQPENEYKMLIQKQPGTKLPEYTITLGEQRQEFILDQDQEIVFPL